MSESTDTPAVPDKVIELPVANASGNEANRRALRNVKVRIFQMEKVEKAKDGEPGASNALPEDPFSAASIAGRVIEPPFDMLTLSMLPEHCGELGQCIEAMEVNCETTGHRYVSRLRMRPSGAIEGSTALASEAEAERVKLVNFFTYATNESWNQFRRRLRRDMEATGNAYIEVVRSQDGEIQSFTHIPSYQMRLGILEDEDQLASRKVLELQVDGSVKVVIRKEWRRFRPYVQCRSVFHGQLRMSAGLKLRWFKEYGDPRPMDRDTGEIKAEGESLPEGRRGATEIIHLRLYSCRSPYGLPRYIGNLLSIFGDRAAEEVNYITFRCNNIPSMFLLVSNGQLTQGTLDRLNSFAESHIQGNDNMSKFVVVEGEPFDTETGEDGGQVKIEAKPLTNVQRTDEMFTNYRAANADRIRRAFRLPPIFMGVSNDYSYSTIQAARSLGDEQVFSPERSVIDDVINRFIFPEMGIVYHSFKSNTPNTTDNVALVKIVAAAEKTGGMTPRIARSALEEILGMDLPPFPAEFPADMPFSLTMAEAVKNKADPSEPGQVVTALKSLGVIGDDLSLVIEDGETDLDVVKKLVKLNAAVEQLWREKAK